MTTYAPGSGHARNTDPVTSRLAGQSDFSSAKERACLLLAIFDKEEGLTSLEIERWCATEDVQRALRNPRPLGVSPWRRITDCFEAGWAEVLTYPDGTPITRLEANGKHQQVFRITDLGRIEARRLRDHLLQIPVVDTQQPTG